MVFLFLLAFQRMEAQSEAGKKRVKLVHTDELLYDREMVDAQRLIGNVHLEYEGTHFMCDSAWLYANDDFDAFSQIRINEPGGYTVSGDLLHFDKKSKTATITNKVTLRDRDMVLTTNWLSYNLDTEVANYTGGGKIVSSANKNTLVSERGIYHAKTETFFFRRDVVLRNPDYTVNCDTMQYNSHSEITYFFGPTTIVGKDSDIYCENGFYNTKKDQSRFGKNARVRSEKTILKGDSIYYDGKAGFGEVFRNVAIRDTTEDFLITGDYGKHIESSNLSFVTGHALMIQDFDGDSLFMHADTLKAVSDSSRKNTIYAYHHVRLFKNDLQGLCDSLVYADADSMMRMFRSPVLWSSQNQVTGDTLSIQLAEKKLHTLHVIGNAFIISDAEAKGDSLPGKEEKFNQIKGRRMTGHFAENHLRSLYVEGNGQLIYFPTDDKDKRPVAMGHNQGECSNIFITVSDNELQRIRMETETNSTFTPMRMSDESRFKLDDFIWRKSERPKSREDVFSPSVR